jgi:hypothetical protein
MKQTAVEWLFNQIKKDIIGLEYDYADELKQAKEMEKQQILFAYNDGAMGAFEKTYKGMNEYYNENYGGINEDNS